MSIAIIAVLQAAALAVPGALPVETYACEYLATDADSPQEPLRPDLIISHTIAKTPAEERWTITWAGKSPVAADQFEAQSGSVGGSTALRWMEADGKMRTAYISYSDLSVADGSKGAWLGLDKPSLWQAPGYLCGTPPLPKSEGAK